MTSTATSTSQQPAPPSSHRGQISPFSKQLLETSYAVNPMPDSESSRALGAKCVPQLTQQQVKLWFKRKRSAEKQAQAPEDDRRVEKVLDKRPYGNGFQYLVSFENQTVVAWKSRSAIPSVLVDAYEQRVREGSSESLRAEAATPTVAPLQSQVRRSLTAHGKAPAAPACADRTWCGRPG